MTKLTACSAIALALALPCTAMAENRQVRESINVWALTDDWQINVYAYDDPANGDSDYGGWIVSVHDLQTGDWQFCDADYRPYSDLVTTSGSGKKGSLDLGEIFCADGLSDDFGGSEFVTISAECRFDGTFYRVFRATTESPRWRNATYT